MHPDRTNELWDKFMNGALDDSGAKELLAFLQGNPEELERRRRDAAINATLRCLFGSDAEQQRLMASVQMRLKDGGSPTEDRDFERRVMRDLRRRRSREDGAINPWWLAGLAAAALIVLTFFATRYVDNNEQPNVAVQPKQTPTNPESTPLPEGVTLSLQTGRASIGTRNLQAPVETRLAPNELLALEPGAIARIPFADGSELSLSDGGRLAIERLSPAPFLKLERGQVVVEVQPQKLGAGFVLSTPHASVKVLGTKYKVRATDRLSHVEVERGKVSVGPPAAASGAERVLEKGQALTANNDGLGQVYTAQSRRMLLPADGATDNFTDPLTLSPSDTVMPWPVRRLSYFKPAGKALGYGGVLWRTRLEPGEDMLEMWIRPRKVEVNPDYRLMKMVILASTGPTEYRLGDVHLYPVDKDWVVLRGKFEGASINWQSPGAPPVALQSESIQQIALRTEIGNIECDFGPIFLLKSGK